MTKASLRHITANDEASSLSGDFIIAHHSPANICILIEVLHLYRCVTHTHTPCLWQGSATEDEVKMKMGGK